MAGSSAARLCLGGGVLALSLTIANQLSAPRLDPPLERASVLASLLAVTLLLIGTLWTRVVPTEPAFVKLGGDQGFELAGDLPAMLRQELAWGSQMLLTATPASVIWIQWRGQVLLRRGLVAVTEFVPGAICVRAQQSERPISLVDLRLYPGRDEFDSLLPELAAVVVQSLGPEGLMVLGGCSSRCFDRSDLAWLEGWGRKIRAEMEALPQDGDAAGPVHPSPEPLS